MRTGWTFDKSTLAVLVNLAQRVRRKRKEIRSLKRLQAKLHRVVSVSVDLQLGMLRVEENEAWNAFQASKKVAIDFEMKRETEEAPMPQKVGSTLPHHLATHGEAICGQCGEEATHILRGKQLACDAHAQD